MALSKKITAQIKEILKKNPQGLSITDIVKVVHINRNTAGRYLESLLVSGEVDMRQFGMAKIYTLSRRLPVSSILSISSERVMQLDHSLRIIFANEPFLELLDVTLKDLHGKNIEYTVAPLVFDDIFPELLTHLKQGLSGTEWMGELALSGPGKVFFCRIAPTVFSDGQKGVSVLLEDITEHRRAEESLRESEEKFRSLFNNANDMITLHGITPDGLPGRYIEVNDVACRRLQYTRDELLLMSPKDLVVPEDWNRAKVNAEYLLANGHATFEMTHLTKDKQRIPVEISAHLFDFRGQRMVLALVRDITERRQSELALKESEERFRTVFEHNPLGIALVHPDFRFRTVNPRFCQMLGYSADQLLNLSFTDITHPDDLLRDVSQVKKFKTGELDIYKTEKRYLKGDGSLIWASVTVSPVMNEHHRVMYAIAMVEDITARKQVKNNVEIKKG